ncbi:MULTISPECIES: MerR family transcriptional regulator [Brevibacterium]|uniref:MerR family transcriptional regulator n=1 Tax=Brevibacterium TaxID=1696 RepID=UPI0031E2237F
MRIGEAAADLGVAAHVLRHWEECGVVVPDRTPTGHRSYDDEHLSRCRIVIACQGVGMSLAEIRQVLHRSAAGRAAVIAERIAAIRRQTVALEAAERFLVHVADCRHDLMTRCPDCAEYAATPTHRGTASAR